MHRVHTLTGFSWWSRYSLVSQKTLLMPSEHACSVSIAEIFGLMMVIVVGVWVMVTLYEIELIGQDGVGSFQVSVLPQAVKFWKGSVPFDVISTIEKSYSPEVSSSSISTSTILLSIGSVISILFVLVQPLTNKIHRHSGIRNNFIVL